MFKKAYIKKCMSDQSVTYFAKMIHFGKRTACSLLDFFNYFGPVANFGYQSLNEQIRHGNRSARAAIMIKQ